MLDSFKKTNAILSNVANMTSSHLSINENTTIKTDSMELSFKRSKATDFEDNIPVSEGKIQMPPLCASMGLQGDGCENLKLTSQVIKKEIYN